MRIKKSIKKAVWWIKFVFIIIPATILLIILCKIHRYSFDIAFDLDEWLDGQNYYEQDFNK